jgi:anthranilate phosphoribosyltransferase
VLIDAITQASQGTHLSREHVGRIFDEIFAGRATAAQIGALLIALRMKGETVEEVTGAAFALRQRARPLRRPTSSVERAGTGSGRSISPRPSRSSPPPRESRSPSTATEASPLGAEAPTS